MMSVRLSCILSSTKRATTCIFEHTTTPLFLQQFVVKQSKLSCGINVKLKLWCSGFTWGPGASSLDVKLVNYYQNCHEQCLKTSNNTTDLDFACS